MTTSSEQTRRSAPASFATARLRAERVSKDHASFFETMWQDPQVTATLGGPRDPEQVAAMLERIEAHWDRYGFGVWTLLARGTGEAVGWAGLLHTDVGGPGSIELLYAVAASHWRTGIATEAGRAVLGIAADLGLGPLVCFTLVDNVGSRRTMERVGFRYATDVEHAGLPHVLYRFPGTEREEERVDG